MLTYAKALAPALRKKVVPTIYFLAHIGVHTLACGVKEINLDGPVGCATGRRHKGRTCYEHVPCQRGGYMWADTKPH